MVLKLTQLLECFVLLISLVKVPKGPTIELLTQGGGISGRQEFFF